MGDEGRAVREGFSEAAACAGSGLEARRPARPGSAEPGALGALGRFKLQMWERSLREEELRAQHQARLLRLREMALREKTLAERALLEQRRG
ncbi:hypothetical protein P7K49_002040 [Saguinus oedipus]|uniref:Uncharacterized protein n=1 Tax=Saguinus oedipus TaxID=9490 RepID=A0ABQ9WI65_SAGOE|nr:hypothetical protein P7K49_002040 [Saguinus oedipus]